MSMTFAPSDNQLISALETALPSLAETELLPVKIAVIDSGIDATHERCLGRVEKSWRYRSDGNDHFAEVPGLPGNNDRGGHGTAVAGIICALAPNASIIDIGILDKHGVSDGASLIEAMRLALRSDARIINISLNCIRKYKPELNELCDEAYRKGRIVVAAKRNMPLVDDLGFPAEIISCVSVGLCGQGNPYDFSYTGMPPIEFAAHGESILAPKSGGGYIYLSGTSFATPIISAMIALMLGKHPNLATFEVKTLLKYFAQTGADFPAPTSNPLECGMAHPFDGAHIDPACRAARCPHCKAYLQIPDFFTSAKCPHCNARVTL